MAVKLILVGSTDGKRLLGRRISIWKDNSEIGIASGTYLKGDKVGFRDGRNLVAKRNIHTPHYVI
jgi:signal peptidase I